ncbi:MAG: hypothetical protein WC595_04630 [Candidatus Nanoarchaeia archaeon]
MLFQTSLNFREYITYLQQVGAYDVVLPFLLVFAIVFAALEKTAIFGKDKSNVNMVVSLVIGLLLVAQQTVVATINNFLPQVSLYLVVALAGLLLVATIAGKEFKGLTGAWLGVACVIAIGALVLAFNPNWSSYLADYDRDFLIGIGLVVGFVILIVWLFSSKKEGDGGVMKFLKSFDAGLRDK